VGDAAEGSVSVRDTPTFQRTPGGELLVTLHEQEVEIIGGLLRDLRVIVGMPPGENAVSSRLYPSAYLDPTEEAAERQWQGLVHDDLVATRVAAFDEILKALTEGATSETEDLVQVSLDEEAEAQLLGVLNDARLALGTIADVSEDFEDEDLDLTPNDPRWHLLRLYGYLSELQAELIDLMLGELPADPND
jgi:hypothetical protein